jgi:HAE1 family hydrophobic/amphiphilic exporter-1
MSQIRISAWAIRNPIPVILFFIAATLAGIVAYTTLPIKQFPNISFPAVAVTVTQSGASPSEVENQITRPIENAIAGLSDLDTVQSIVTQGVSTTIVQFKIGYDLQKATDDVRAKVDQTRSQLPREIDTPNIQRLEIDSQPIITYAVEAPGMSTEQLSWFIENDLSRRLQGLEGVAAIGRIGGVDREINVILDPVRMAAAGVTAPQVNQALTTVSADASGGRVDVGGREQTVRVLGAAVTVDQVRNLSIPVGSRAVRVGDVAEVGDGNSEIRSFARLNGRPVVGFQVQKTKEASDVAVETLVDKELEKLTTVHKTTGRERMMNMFGEKDPKTGKAKVLPDEVQPEFKGVKIQKIFSRVFETRNSYDSTLHSMLEGMVLASLVVWLFLRDWRATAITALAMPASLIPTFVVMMLCGFSLNMITLLALTLVIGILVDDAIVEIENIEKRVHRGLRPYYAALEGADQIGLAVVATTFAIFVVFLPVSFMPGLPGQFFKEFGLTVCISVLFSLIVARFLTPLMAAYFLKPKQEGPRKPLPGYYVRSLDWALDHRMLTCVIGGALFALSIYVAVAFVPKGLTPESNPDFYAIDIDGPAGSTLQSTSEAADAATQLVLKRPETTGVFLQLGSGAVDQSSGGGGSAPSSPNRALITVLVKHGNRPTVPQIHDQLRDQLLSIPDARVNFAAEGFGSNGVQMVLTSETGEGLDESALKLQEQMRTIPLLGDPRPGTAPSGTEIVIRPRPAEAARLGVTAQTIAQIARVATVGDIDANVAKLTSGERRVPIRVRLPENVRADLPALKAMLIPTANGGSTTLDTVADVSFQAGPAQIDRMNRRRQITIKADLVGGAQLGDAMNAINNLPIMKNLPAGVTPATAGEQQAYVQLFVGFIIAILSGIGLVYAVMVLLFGSFFKPVTILMSLPLAIGGGIFGLLVMGQAINMPSAIGFLMLMGLAAKNSILLVEYAIEREREGVGMREAIIEACHERARPIVMTTLAMMAGMAPTALGIGVGAEFRQPMAVAVIGGLITSTALSLVMVPVVYEMIDTLEHWLIPRLGKLVTPKDAPKGEVPHA